MGRVSDARERLLDAANELTWKLGYNAVTVDAICDRAGVKKGSFYHYFESKAALSKAAIEDWWQKNSRPMLDAAFAPTTPPLERLQRYYASLHQKQVERQRAGEQVLGCLGFSVAMGRESVDPEVWETTEHVLRRKRRYFETTIEDAAEAGLIKVSSVESAVQAVYSLFEGAMARARIQNSPEPLVGLYEQTLRLLGVEQPLRKQA
jgi:TetR/AcrR family transcriptional regulator, transcriptional repressor for nem operon